MSLWHSCLLHPRHKACCKSGAQHMNFRFRPSLGQVQLQDHYLQSRVKSIDKAMPKPAVPLLVSALAVHDVQQGSVLSCPQSSWESSMSEMGTASHKVVLTTRFSSVEFGIAHAFH